MAQLKSTLVQGALTVTGNAVASKLIKNGGTSDDILLGDGSTTSKSALMAMINAAVVLKGTAGTGGTVTKTTFPAASESTLGDAYKVITKDTYQGVAAKVGDMLICYYTGSGYAWMLIPSGDDIEDTWREIKVNGTQILANGTTTNPLNLKAGTNMTLTNSNGTVTFDATDTGATTVSITGDGNAFTNAEYNASTRTITFTKGSKFLTSHQSLANYVTLNGAQTITGVKTFSAQPVISTANGLKFDSGNCKLRIYNTSASPMDYAAIEVRSNSASTNRNLFIDLANNSLVVGAASGTADTTYKVNVKGTFNATTIYQNGITLDNTYLGKTTYEWNKEFAAGSNGAVSLGRYNIYDSQLTFDITTTTSFTLSGKLVIASQNGKILKATIYGDASNTLAGYLTIYQSAITNNRSWVEVFCNFPGWSKNKVHIYGVALNSATVTNQMTSVTFTNGVPSGVTSGDAKWTGSIVNDITSHCATADHTHDNRYVKYNAAQTLTDAQKTQARANIGAGTSNFSGNYNDLTNKPTIPTVNNATLTIQKNGTTVKTFTANASTDVTANITVPTKTSELTNDSGFLKAESDTLQTVTNRGATTNKAITTAGLTTTSTLYVTGTTGHREGIRIAPFGNLSSIWWNATGTQDYTTGQMWGITAYDKGYTLDATKTNTFRFRGPDSSTATSATDQMWINTSGLVTSRGGFAKSGSSDSYVLLAGGGTKAISDITGTTYDADRGISLKNGKFGHSNTAVTAVTTAGLYKIKYDAYGHITGTESFTLPTVNNGTLTIQKNGTNVATFTANQSGNATANITVPTKVSELTNDSKFLTSESDTLQTVTTRGATTDKSITALSYSVNSAVTMEYDSSYKALKFVFA